MAIINKYEAQRFIKKVFKEYISALKKSRQYNKELDPETNILFKDSTNFEHLINSSNLKQNIFDRLNHEGLKQLFDYSKDLAKWYELKSYRIIRNLEICDDNVLDRIETIKILLKGNVFNDKEDIILSYLNSFTDDELQIVQKDLYDLQAKIYKKFDFTQRQAAREFYNTHRKGLFVTKDHTGEIVKLNYTPGNDVVFVNWKGELLNYYKYNNGSRSEFFGNALGIGKNRAAWMMMIAGYDFNSTKGMNIPTTNSKRSTFSEFNIFGNELKSELSPQHKRDKVKIEVFKKYPEIYAKFGDRISEVEGKIIKLDDGKGKVLAGVPYYHQCDNDTVDGDLDGNDMCQLTSFAMLLASKEIKPVNKSKQLEDLLYEIAKDNGRGGRNLWNPVQSTYKKIISKLKEKELLNCNELVFEPSKGFFYEDEDFSIITSQIDKGNPVIVDLKHGSKYQYGHVVLCIGYTESSLIVHDPYGNLEHGINNGYGGNKRDYNGAFVEYPKIKYKLGKNWIRFLEEVNNEEDND